MLNKRNLRLGTSPNLNPPISEEARQRIARQCHFVTTPRMKRRVPHAAQAAYSALLMGVVDQQPPVVRATIHELGLRRTLRARKTSLAKEIRRLSKLPLFAEHYELAKRHKMTKA